MVLPTKRKSSGPHRVQIRVHANGFFAQPASLRQSLPFCWQPLYLDSGTLTPVLKKLEGMGYLTRSRKPEDERVVIVEITKEGMELRKKAEKVPYDMKCLINRKGELFTPEEAAALKEQLYRILHALE